MSKTKVPRSSGPFASNLNKKTDSMFFLDNGCTIIGQDNAQDTKTNSNNLTQPKMIFYWQVHIETKGIVF